MPPQAAPLPPVIVTSPVPSNVCPLTVFKLVPLTKVDCLAFKAANKSV